MHKSRLVCKWELTYDVVNWDEDFESERNGIIISARWWSTVQLDAYSERNFLEQFFPNEAEHHIQACRDYLDLVEGDDALDTLVLGAPQIRFNDVLMNAYIIS